MQADPWKNDRDGRRCGDLAALLRRTNLEVIDAQRAQLEAKLQAADTLKLFGVQFNVETVRTSARKNNGCVLRAPRMMLHKDVHRHSQPSPRSNCVLDVSKLLATGVKIRPVEEALDSQWGGPAPEKLINTATA